MRESPPADHGARNKTEFKARVSAKKAAQVSETTKPGPLSPYLCT
jgi:hypothetical protein